MTKHTVRFRIMEDDMTGEYGLIPLGCIDSEFNTFWDGIGIFHDVFEHWFEDEHKYFKGENAFNRGGECSAMGAAMYYFECLGLSNRQLSNYHYFMNSARLENEDALIEGIKYDDMRYGTTLECGVPYQKSIGFGDLEYQVDTLYENIKNTPISTDNYENCKALKQSVTKSKLQRLYRWGYRMAERLVPENWENRETCHNFIEFWNKFCKNNDAETLQGYQIVINVYKKKGVISWNAYLLHDGQKTKITTPCDISEILYQFDTY